MHKPCILESFAMSGPEGANRWKSNVNVRLSNVHTNHLFKVDQSLIDKRFVALMDHGHVFDEQGHEGDQWWSKLGQDHSIPTMISSKAQAGLSIELRGLQATYLEESINDSY